MRFCLHRRAPSIVQCQFALRCACANRASRFARLIWPVMRYHTDSHHPSCGEFLAEYNACYDRTPVRSVAELNALIAHTLHGLKTVRCPLLVVRAGKDETVAPESAEIIMNRTASSKKRLLTLPDSPPCVYARAGT